MTGTDVAARIAEGKPQPPQVHLVGISGGKDSAATYLRALERGLPFRAVMADVGNDHPLTVEFALSLPEKTGGPPVEVIRADFTAEIAVKRENIARDWPEQGVPDEVTARALEVLQPTGIPFLDLCLWKGLFPSSQARFCTEHLKTIPIREQVVTPILAGGQTVVSWQGVRAQESAARALLPRLQRLNDPRGKVLVYRPLLTWTLEDVWDIHRRHGLEPNPLYAMGAHRVGCLPCVMGRKSEVRMMAERFPEEVERIAEWERMVSAVSRRQSATFYYVGRDPKGLMDIRHGVTITHETHGIRMMVDWSRTGSGGRQADLFPDPPSDALIHYGEVCGTEGTCE